VSESVTVDKYPKCDFCPTDARYDGQTGMGPWANMCQEHFDQHGVGLGTGKGQKYLLSPSMPRFLRDLDTIDLDHDLGIRDLTDPFTGEMV